ncbi:hypothetical protein ASPZODRAFT_60124 [Penicilliopsis zonata CBS 506.65]|uniref:Uncharacterized protein n=1 Tax=Penicilliopsis zonata CBS 506.65 TaxID=1073090 RepID=A0A1L9SQ17_9EURO|nr:hypothetical protein ASPZODRAFT_60124 [Penicilliopsis zonata CBS 506.65]OJJ49325.1 hypothetical protein ASPZODRAFT_60124 [Penicilliopsis zonata CBS 506.65]
MGFFKHFAKTHRHWRLYLILIAIELPLTIVLLTLTGIASHGLYRTKLWQAGYDLGFNSSPDEVIYALANYRSYTIPVVWSSFLTNFNLVIGVLSTFLLIVKFPVHVMRLLYPPIAVAIQGSLVALYIVSARYQAGSDMTDSSHPQPGPPWYITKNCNVAKDVAINSIVGYCEQAKSLFAVTIILLTLYFVEFCVCVHSCFLTKEEKESRREQREEKRMEKEFEEMILKSPGMIPMTPAPRTGTFPSMMTPRTGNFPPMMTPGTGNFPPMMTPRTGTFPPMVTPRTGNTMPPLVTPRTLAFNRLDGMPSGHLPLRGPPPSNNTSTPYYPTQPDRGDSSHSPTPVQMYFPPPPKAVTK